MKTLRYFYHPDHLGSSSVSTPLNNHWITDGSGNAIQHLHYLPFGEDWVDQRNASWSAPYTFSGKEKDVETGYSYFGARYYDSGLSIWLSVDPMSDKYPNLTPYAYCANNPVILVDPDGRDIWELDNLGNVIKHIPTKEYDKFIINGKEETFKYGTVISTRSEKALYIKKNEDGTEEQAVTNVDIYKVRGDDKAKRLFEFVATNTVTEWGHIKTGIKGDRGLNFLTTGHIEDTEPGINTIITGQLQHGYTIREIIHSHPKNTAIPSGIPGLTGIRGDVPSAKNITDWYSIKYPQRSDSPKFYLFLPGNGDYVPYSKDSKASDFGY